MLGLVGDPLRAKMVKEATSILKGVTRLQPSGSHDNRTRCRLSPYLVQCYSCYGWGHIGRNCKTGRAVCNLGTTFSINFHVSFAFVVLVLIFSLPLGWVIFTLSVDLGGAFSMSQFRTWFGAWGQQRAGFPVFRVC